MNAKAGGDAVKCEHDIDWKSALIAEHDHKDCAIVDVWCRKCGVGASAIIEARDLNWDDDDSEET